jgi:ribosomal-protein-alanine N-acetyltransferase
MSLQLDTERLLMRPFHIEDAHLLVKLNSDPDVTRYTGEGAYESLEEAEAFINGYDQYDQYQMGRLNIFIKATGEYVGWCGLKYIPATGVIDLGYRLVKKHWGKGYATESAKASLDYGFKVLGLEKIIGKAMVENTPSINVFKKLGLTYSHSDECGHHPGVVYVITKDKWK